MEIHHVCLRSVLETSRQWKLTVRLKTLRSEMCIFLRSSGELLCYMEKGGGQFRLQ